MSQVNDGAPAETPGPDDALQLDESFVRAAPFTEPPAADRDRVRYVTGSSVLPAAQRNVQAVFRRLHVNLGGPAALGVLIAAIVIVAGVMMMLLGPGHAHAVTTLVHTRIGLPG
ncbi:MAG TPA: hypothetical protein VGL93_21640 [Streptosporangiaceae bacterium]|jgi:hypothetical protein